MNLENVYYIRGYGESFRTQRIPVLGNWENADLVGGASVSELLIAHCPLPVAYYFEHSILEFLWSVVGRPSSVVLWPP